MISLAVGWIACMSLLRSNWTSGADFATVMMPQVLQGFAMSFFMLPLTIVTLNSVRPEETASATGIQNFTRTLFSGMSTAIVLTVWANSQQTAQADLAGRVNVEEAMRSAANAGMSQDQGLAMLMNLVNREAATMAIDYVFLASTLVFAICATVIWLAPRPRGGYAGTATGGH
jgi:MFS transporter, DHA2 family, multidrug resistance protein